jgi:hypothetical protein
MTIAQVRQQRITQLRKVRAALRSYDSQQEALERLLKRYLGKRTIIETNDLPALNTAFSAMNGKFSAVETELANLFSLVQV